MQNETPLLTAAVLSAVAGIVISLLASYVPKFNTWYAGQDSDTKRLLMLGALLVATLLTFGASCANLALPFLPVVACTTASVPQLTAVFIMAAIANSVTYNFTPQPQAVKQVLADRKEALPPTATV